MSVRDHRCHHLHGATALTSPSRRKSAYHLESVTLRSYLVCDRARRRVCERGCDHPRGRVLHGYVSVHDCASANVHVSGHDVNCHELVAAFGWLDLASALVERVDVCGHDRDRHVHASVCARRANDHVHGHADDRHVCDGCRRVAVVASGAEHVPEHVDADACAVLSDHVSCPTHPTHVDDSNSPRRHPGVYAHREDACALVRCETLFAVLQDVPDIDARCCVPARRPALHPIVVIACQLYPSLLVHACASLQSAAAAAAVCEDELRHAHAVPHCQWLLSVRSVFASLLVTVFELAGRQCCTHVEHAVQRTDCNLSHAHVYRPV